MDKPVKYVSEVWALSDLASYCVINDIADRQWQIEHGGPDHGQVGRQFFPTGLWLNNADEVSDPQNLSFCLKVKAILDLHRFRSGLFESNADIKET